jgi:hypothetical protein
MLHTLINVSKFEVEGGVSEYHAILRITNPRLTYTEQVDALLAAYEHLVTKELPDSVPILKRFFLSDAANQLPLLRASVLYADVLSRGAFSWGEQPPLDGSKITLILTVTTDSVTVSGTPDLCVVACGGVKRLYHSVRFTADEVAGLSPKEQTEEAFGRHIDWLNAEGLSLADNCVRTWLYVRDIDHNYHGVVEGRNANIEERLKTRAKGDGTARLDGKNKPEERQMPNFGALSNIGESIWDRGDEKRGR